MSTLKKVLTMSRRWSLAAYLIIHTGRKWFLGAKELVHKGGRVWLEQDFYECIRKYKRKHTQVFMVSIDFRETEKSFLKT
jgi:hypothetical protein